MGGSCDRATHQCLNEATHLVKGKTKQEKKGPPMRICIKCLKAFLERNPDYAKLVLKEKT
jgi:hypothetical protein